jgi:hypothetical protein
MFTTMCLVRAGRTAAQRGHALGGLLQRQPAVAGLASSAMDKRDTRVAAAALNMLDSKRKCEPRSRACAALSCNVARVSHISGHAYWPPPPRVLYFHMLLADNPLTFLHSNLLLLPPAVLEQVAKAPAHYTAVDELVGASMGAHMRHSLDHYSKLIAASGGAAAAAAPPVEVHYDNRERHTAIESDVGAAIALVDSLAAKIVQLGAAPMHSPVAANFMLEVKGLEHRMESTLERELFFCTHHAVHHMAMIALILQRLGGYDPSLTVAGRAPSTRYDDQRAL